MITSKALLVFKILLLITLTITAAGFWLHDVKVLLTGMAVSICLIVLIKH